MHRRRNAASLPARTQRLERLPSELKRALRRAGAMLVKHGQLLVGVQAVARFAENVLPKLGGAVEILLAFGQPGKLAPRGAIRFFRKPGFKRALVKPPGEFARAAPLEETGEPVELEGVVARGNGRRVGRTARLVLSARPMAVSAFGHPGCRSAARGRRPLS